MTIGFLQKAYKYGSFYIIVSCQHFITRYEQKIDSDLIISVFAKKSKM